MVSFARKHQRQQPPAKGRVLSKQEASALLSANKEYLKSIDTHVGERHRSEILAEQMVREGLDDLASTMIQLHDAMKGFAKGDFKEGQLVTESPDLRFCSRCEAHKICYVDQINR